MFLEIEPDRGSDLILEPLQRVKQICQQEKAILLVVDFWFVQRWRAHGGLSGWLRTAVTEIRIEQIAPREIVIDGKYFDPHKHFGAWREKQRSWERGKEERTKRSLNRARELREQGYSYPRIADTLNKEEFQSPTGRPWTTDNIRKFMDQLN